MPISSSWRVARLKGLRKRVTYANVVATVALFFALGGASYAMTQLPPNSVGEQQLSFPVGQTSQTRRTERRILPGCRIGFSQANVARGTCPVWQRALVSAHVSLKKPGHLLVLGLTQVAEESKVRIPPLLITDGVASEELHNLTTHPTTVVISGTMSASAGSHVIGMFARDYLPKGRGTSLTFVRPQLIVIALPSLK